MEEVVREAVKISLPTLPIVPCSKMCDIKLPGSRKNHWSLGKREVDRRLTVSPIDIRSEDRCVDAFCDRGDGNAWWASTNGLLSNFEYWRLP